MNIESVQCNNCGAPLELPESARFATCRHCGAQLAVHRSTAAVTTEVLERVAAQVDRVADEVQQLRIQNELQRLDMNWERERQKLFVRTKNGPAREPTEASGIVVMVIACVMALVFGGVAASNGFGAGIVGAVLMALGGVFAGFQIMNKSRQMRTARSRYQTQRSRVLRELNDERI